MDYWARFPENGFKKPKNGPDLRFCFSIRIEDDEAVFTIDSITGFDDEMLAVSFPYKPLRWQQSDHAILVLGFRRCGTVATFPSQPSYTTRSHSQTARQSSPA